MLQKLHCNANLLLRYAIVGVLYVQLSLPAWLIAQEARPIPTDGTTRLNATARLLLRHSTGAAPLPASYLRQYGIRSIKGTDYVQGYLFTEPNFRIPDLEAIGGKVLTQTDEIFTIELPVRQLPALSTLAGYSYFECASAAYHAMDTARVVSRVNLVHQGLELSHPYKGKGVVVGVVDQGFDFMHPDLQMMGATHPDSIRVRRLWNQKDTTGTKPDRFGDTITYRTDFTYGSEFKLPDAIRAVETDDTSGSHGANVVGIASGSGNQADGKYRGVAPEADLVLVASPFTNTSISDGVKYIFAYADWVKKPAVVNLSIGGTNGPRDGTSAFDRTISRLVGRGKIVCGAAGNNGLMNTHISRRFNAEGTDTLYTSLHWRPNDPPKKTSETDTTKADTLLSAVSCEFWGSRNQQYSYGFALVDSMGNVVAQVPSFAAAATSLYERDTLFIFPKTGSADNDTIRMYFNVRPALLNFNGRIQLFVYLSTTNRLRYFPRLAFTARNTELHGWMHAFYPGTRTWFTDTIPGYGKHPNLTNGDNNYTVTEVGGVARDIITVGAFTSKNRYFSYAMNQERDVTHPAPIGAIAPFSSIGPTLDGRIKPDIASPGNQITAALSSYQSPPDSALVAYYPYQGRNYPYGSYWGTSMATPHVTGIIALLLEANPFLDPTQTRTILQQTAYQDDWTGTISTGGSPIWGAGKVNAHQAIKRALELYTNRNDDAPAHQRLSIYPNPAQSNFTIALYDANTAATSATIAILDALGRVVSSKNIQFTDGIANVSLHGVPAGVYSVRLNRSSNGTTRSDVTRLVVVQ